MSGEENGHRKNVVIASIENGVVKVNVKLIAAAAITIATVLYGGIDNARSALGWGPETEVTISTPDVAAAVSDAMKPIADAVDGVETTVKLLAGIQEEHTNGEHVKTEERLDEGEARLDDLSVKQEAAIAKVDEMSEQVGENTAALKTVSGQSTEIIGLVRELITKEEVDP